MRQKKKELLIKFMNGTNYNNCLIRSFNNLKSGRKKEIKVLRTTINIRKNILTNKYSNKQKNSQSIFLLSLSCFSKGEPLLYYFFFYAIIFFSRIILYPLTALLFLSTKLLAFSSCFFFFARANCFSRSFFLFSSYSNR